jgi:hypothetical protein
MKILIGFGLALLVCYFFGKLAIQKKLLNDKLVNYSKLPTFLDFIRAGSIITMFIIFIIIMAIILIILSIRFLMIAIPVGVVLILIYMIYLGYKLFKK